MPLASLFQTPEIRHRAVLGVTAICALCIAVGSFWPPSEQGGPSGYDKLMHALAFFALTAPAALFHRDSLRWLVPFGLSYGAAIEVIQPAFRRSAEWLDLLAAGIGIALALCVGFLFNSLKRSTNFGK